MRIRWTKPAATDFARICEFSAERFGAARSHQTAMTIYDSADSLTTFPERGRKGKKPNTRELTLPGLPFVMIYHVREPLVEILRILHGAQKWP